MDIGDNEAEATKPGAELPWSVYHRLCP